MDPERRGLGLRRRGRTRLNLAAAHVAELCGEIEPLVRGARVRDVHPLPPRDLILVLEPAEGAGRVRRLRLSADPEAPRLHLQHARVADRPGPPGPFFRKVAEDLSGGTLAGLAPVRGDRIAMIEVRDAPAGERRALVLELFGRRANLVLLGPGDRVLAALVAPPPGETRPRLAPGEAWRPPEARAARPGDLPPADLVEALGAPGPFEDEAPLSRLVEEALGAQSEAVRRGRAARDLAQRLGRRLERARSLVRGLEARAGAVAEIERLREDGELLKANLARVTRGMQSVEVEDLFAASGGTRRIALDPGLSPRRNLERIFQRAKKLERSRATVEDELALARRREVELAELLDATRTDAADPAALEERAVGSGLLEPRQAPAPRRRTVPAARLPYRVFTAARGSEIRVGRSARDNDDLTFRHAKGSDLWLHTADAPGSHVVLVLEKGADPDSEEMIDAAHLAAHFSPLRGSPRVRIHVARRKEVHKPRGAKAGLVQLSGGRILDVRVQPERLRRLLGSRERPSGEPETAP